MSNVLRGIGPFGSVALLVSSMTGPGLSTIPPMFQQSGWIAPVFVFIIVGVLSGCSALFVCEAMSNVKGNEKFQAKVELTTIAQVYLGKRYHYFFQIILFLALQAVNVTSIILSTQTIDGMLVNLFHGTCGLRISPGAWYCVTTSDGLGNSVFSSDEYFLFTFGFIISGILVIPLGFFSLVENIVVQMVAFVVLVIILILWMVSFGSQGLNPDLLPASGPDASIMLGIVIFNFSYITTIPSWVNSLRPGVSIKKCLWVSVAISALFYLLIGILGAMAFEMDPQSDILSILGASGSTMAVVTTYIFPIAALVTSIPVFTIVIRSNLLRGRICNRPWAIFLSNFFPWFVCIPLITSNLVGTIQNWSSLFFQSTVNYILPFVLYFASRRHAGVVEAPLTEKQLSEVPQDDPDNIIMYNPEENMSISIRRSNIQSRISRVEQRSIMSPLSYMPTPREHPTEVLDIPTLVLPDIPADTPSSPKAQVNRQVPGTPKHSSGTPRKMLGSPRLGSGSPGQLRPSSENTLVTTNPDNTANQQAPGSEQVVSHPPTGGLGIRQPDSVYLTDNKNTSLSPAASSQKQQQLTPTLIQPPTSPASGRTQSVLLTQSVISSEHNMSTVYPDETVYDVRQVTDDRFYAFKPRPWLNPFYVAIISSGLLGISIVFMIIYNVTMAAMGNTVF